MAKGTFTDKDLSSSEFLPEGESIVTIKSVEDRASKEAGTPMVEVVFEDSIGRSDRQFFVLSEKALFRLARLFSAVGLSAKNFDTDKLIGKKVRLLKEFKGMRSGPENKQYRDYNYSYGPVDPNQQPQAPANDDVFGDDDIGF